MNILVAYYSMNGNTDYAARKIAERTGADMLRLEPVRAYPTEGFRKFLRGGRSAVMEEKPALKPYQFEADNYDLVIIGFPVWAGNIAPPVRTFVSNNQLKAVRYAAFACQSGSGAERAFRKLKDCLGRDPEQTLALIDPKDKRDPAKDLQIDEFCDLLSGQAGQDRN